MCGGWNPPEAESTLLILWMITSMDSIKLPHPISKTSFELCHIITSVLPRG